MVSRVDTGWRLGDGNCIALRVDGTDGPTRVTGAVLARVFPSGPGTLPCKLRRQQRRTRNAEDPGSTPGRGSGTIAENGYQALSGSSPAIVPFASVAQWQSTRLVGGRSWVRLPPEARTIAVCRSRLLHCLNEMGARPSIRVHLVSRSFQWGMVVIRQSRRALTP
jgi:hypothetical protein